MQDLVDKLLSHFDKENEAIRKSKALSELDGGRRERREKRDGIRPLTNIVTNQVTQLPDIHHSPHHYSEVVTMSYTNWTKIFTEFFPLTESLCINFLDGWRWLWLCPHN